MCYCTVRRTARISYNQWRTLALQFKARTHPAHCDKTRHQSLAFLTQNATNQVSSSSETGSVM